MSKKKKVIEALFQECQKKKNMVFHNDLVKSICQKIGFGNPFDVTKLDDKSKIPDLLKREDYTIIHLGKGFHQFLKGIDKAFHTFEPIREEIDWEYQKSVLNEYNTSESNILSVANNQRILHHFLFGKDTEFEDVEIEKRPKTYFPHRTKTSLSYKYDTIPVTLDKMQIEIDLTIEYQGTVGIFEAKNGKPENFSVYQLFHPYLYYYNAKKYIKKGAKIKKIIAVYLVKNKDKKNTYISLWAYTFTDPTNICSIKLLKSSRYKLIVK